jgi:hypothetical protein
MSMDKIANDSESIHGIVIEKEMSAARDLGDFDPALARTLQIGSRAVDLHGHILRHAAFMWQMNCLHSSYGADR